jgi:hypothetical protein
MARLPSLLSRGTARIGPMAFVRARDHRGKGSLVIARAIQLLAFLAESLWPRRHAVPLQPAAITYFESVCEEVRCGRRSTNR